MTKTKDHQYAAIIQKVPDLDGAYVEYPYDRRAEFGRGRLKVHATFGGETNDGGIVNMGLKSPYGTIGYIIGLRNEIRAIIGKQSGDVVGFTITPRND